MAELTDMVAEDLKGISDTLNDVQKDLVDQFKLSIEATHDELSSAIDLLKSQVMERLAGLKESLKPKEEPVKEPAITLDQIKPLITQELETVNRKIDEVKSTHNQILEKILLKLKGLEEKLAKPE